MRLSEKYGRWGIVCGGTIVRGSTQQSPCLGRRECLCRWIVYRGESLPVIVFLHRGCLFAKRHFTSTLAILSHIQKNRFYTGINTLNV
jgi:hypothetical protein